MLKIRKKLFITIGVIWVVIIIVACLIFYFNSTEHLRKVLVNNTWYEDVLEEIMEEMTTGTSTVLYFRVDGSGVAEEYRRYHYKNFAGDQVVSTPQYADKNSFSWEILSDKTLHIRGSYYTYPDEWHLNGNNELVINKTTYTSWNGCAYSKDGLYL